MNAPPDVPSDDVLLSLNRASTTAKLTAGAVHDVNNALQVISGSVELLEQQPDLPVPVARSLDRIRRQCDRAAEVLADLQRFTKAGLEGRERFDLRAVVEHAVALRRYAATRMGLSVEIRGDERTAVLAVGNMGAVQQAVLNLLINAEQAMAGAPGAIVVGFAQDGDMVGVQVADSGGGVPEPLRERLFTPFVSSRPAAEGAGLGLWAAQTIARSMGGRVEIAPVPSGTTVVMWLPTALR